MDESREFAFWCFWPMRTEFGHPLLQVHALILIHRLCREIALKCPVDILSRNLLSKIGGSIVNIKALAALVLVRLHCSNLVEVSIEPIHSRSELCKYAHFPPSEAIALDMSVLVGASRILSYSIWQSPCFSFRCRLVYDCGLGLLTLPLWCSAWLGSLSCWFLCLPETESIPWR